MRSSSRLLADRGGLAEDAADAASPSASLRSPAGVAGTRNAPASPGPGPPLTTLPWSGSRLALPRPSAGPLPRLHTSVHRTRRPLPEVPAGATPAPQAPMKTLSRPASTAADRYAASPGAAVAPPSKSEPGQPSDPTARPNSETERRRRVVAEHRATIGDWSPASPATPPTPRRPVADHVVEVAAGGLESGPLRILCRSENSRRSADLEGSRPRPAPDEVPITHVADRPHGPAVASKPARKRPWMAPHWRCADRGAGNWRLRGSPPTTYGYPAGMVSGNRFV